MPVRVWTEVAAGAAWADAAGLQAAASRAAVRPKVQAVVFIVGFRFSGSCRRAFGLAGAPLRTSRANAEHGLGPAGRGLSVA